MIPRFWSFDYEAHVFNPRQPAQGIVSRTLRRTLATSATNLSISIKKSEFKRQMPMIVFAVSGRSHLFGAILCSSGCFGCSGLLVAVPEQPSVQHFFLLSTSAATADHKFTRLCRARDTVSAIERTQQNTYCTHMNTTWRISMHFRLWIIQ